MNDNYFTTLNKLNVTKHVEKKGKFNYLSWAYAWKELKTLHPAATSKVIKNKDGCIYHHDGKTCWVEVSVTVGDVEHIEYYPILNHSNTSISLEKVTSMNVNTSIQRATTKAIARHGLGLAIYANEDLPEAIEVFDAKKAEKYFQTLASKQAVNDAVLIAHKKYPDNIKEIESMSEKKLNDLTSYCIPNNI